MEETLVEKLALTYLRLQRCARAEAEYHGAAWWPRGDRGGEDAPDPAQLDIAR